MRQFRLMTLEVAEERGRPLLVGARIPENLQGCHFHGLDIETWVHARLYMCVDDHHASDGYATAPIEGYRNAS